MKPFQAQTYYELLEVSVSATAPEILAAHERLARLYGDDSMALYGLTDASHMADLKARLAQARDTLTDDSQRAHYDARIGLPPRDIDLSPAAPAPVWTAPTQVPEPVPAAQPIPRVEVVMPPPLPLPLTRVVAQESAPVAEEWVDVPVPKPSVEAPVPGSTDAAGLELRPRESVPRLKSFELPPGAEFSGELLRRVREARGYSMEILAEKTRIGTKHLEAVEADRYGALPATVYLRGMLMSIARELGLDALAVSKGYLQLVERSKG